MQNGVSALVASVANWGSAETLEERADVFYVSVATGEEKLFRIIKRRCWVIHSSERINVCASERRSAEVFFLGARDSESGYPFWVTRCHLIRDLSSPYWIAKKSYTVTECGEHLREGQSRSIVRANKASKRTALLSVLLPKKK
jgi:hypothetical protein